MALYNNNIPENMIITNIKDPKTPIKNRLYLSDFVTLCLKKRFQAYMALYNNNIPENMIITNIKDTKTPIKNRLYLRDFVYKKESSRVL
jgi:predicted membrane-bound spermidine synthase